MNSFNHYAYGAIGEWMYRVMRLPNAQLAGVTESGQALAKGNGILDWRQDGATVAVEVGSGQYRFSYPMRAASP